MKLVAVTQSTLLQVAELRDGLTNSARLLLDAGADPNQAMDSEHGPLSALDGAVGRNHDAELARMLLAAGANPNDGESLSATALNIAVLQGDADLTRFLLEHGASWQERHGHATTCTAHSHGRRGITSRGE